MRRYYGLRRVVMPPVANWVDGHIRRGQPDTDDERDRLVRWLTPHGVRATVDRNRSATGLPIVWRNHTTVLWLPSDLNRSAILFDPERGRPHRRHTRPPVLTLSRALGGRPLRLLPLRAMQRVRHDTLCAVWAVWWLCVGHRRPLATADFRTVFTFLQNAVAHCRRDFMAYLLHDQAMSLGLARTIVWTLRRPDARQLYIRAFRSGA